MCVLTRESLKKQLDYDPKSGAFKYKVAKGNKKAGDLAGCITTNGYRSIMVDGVVKQAHVLAWFYFTGEWPDGQIDHIDGDRLNNSIDNLRVVTGKQNCWNIGVKKSNKLGIKGVRYREDNNKYQVTVCLKSYGCYEDLELAEFVAQEVRQSLHGEYARHA